jgi:peptidyl-dipeptidase Dcp
MIPAFAAAVSAALLVSAMALPVLAKPRNPLLVEWSGAHGGYPPLARVRVEDFQPAFDAAMAQKRREIAAITSNRSAPSFANTILALEQSGAAFDRVRVLFNLWGGSLNTPPFQRVKQEMAPRLAAFDDELVQNEALYKRIAAVNSSPEMARLNAEQKRLVWSYHTQFVKQGAAVDAGQKPRLAQINQSLASLQTRFGQNQLADEAKPGLVITDGADLAGLSASQIAAAADEAERRGLRGQWVIANTRSAMEPFLSASSRRNLRELGWRTWTRRGDNGDENDNNAIVSQILSLRAERAHLLGYPTFAHWQLTDTMAAEPAKTMALMQAVWQAAIAQVRIDVAAMQKLVDAEQGGFSIQAWDYRYYAEKLRKSQYDIDIDELRPYLQLDRVREAMFWAAGKLYGLRFIQVRDVPVFHPDTTVYEVTDQRRRRIGLWYFDPYAREGKNSGAWMMSYRAQRRSGGVVTPIVSNNANFTRGQRGRPVLISWDDANTMFHEFGHALHGLNSRVTYASLAGPNSLADFGEFPAQLNEHWLTSVGVLNRLVDEKGRAMPRELISRLRLAQSFNLFSAVDRRQVPEKVELTRV